MASYQYIFVMQNLTKVLPGGRELFKNITLSFFPGAKIGVLGVNGAGKSTLLKIMAGIDKEFSGEAWAADGVKIGYLEQEPQLDPGKNVMQNVMDGLGETQQLLQRFHRRTCPHRFCRVPVRGQPPLQPSGRWFQSRPFPPGSGDI